MELAMTQYQTRMKLHGTINFIVAGSPIVKWLNLRIGWNASTFYGIIIILFKLSAIF